MLRCSRLSLRPSLTNRPLRCRTASRRALSITSQAGDILPFPVSGLGLYAVFGQHVPLLCCVPLAAIGFYAIKTSIQIAYWRYRIDKDRYKDNTPLRSAWNACYKQRAEIAVRRGEKVFPSLREAQDNIKRKSEVLAQQNIGPSKQTTIWDLLRNTNLADGLWILCNVMPLTSPMTKGMLCGLDPATHPYPRFNKLLKDESNTWYEYTLPESLTRVYARMMNELLNSTVGLELATTTANNALNFLCFSLILGTFLYRNPKHIPSLTNLWTRILTRSVSADSIRYYAAIAPPFVLSTYFAASIVPAQITFLVCAALICQRISVKVLDSAVRRYQAKSRRWLPRRPKTKSGLHP